MIIDTSVWITYLKNPKHPSVSRMDAVLDHETILLPAPVLAELVQGVRPNERSKFQRILGAFDVLVPTDQDWQWIMNQLESNRFRGQTFGIVDLEIAALANRLGLPVWSLDKDFQRLQKLGSVRLF